MPADRFGGPSFSGDGEESVEQSVEMIVRNYGGFIAKKIRNEGFSDPTDIEDITAEVRERLLQSLPDLRSADTLPGFLYWEVRAATKPWKQQAIRDRQNRAGSLDDTAWVAKNQISVTRAGDDPARAIEASEYRRYLLSQLTARQASIMKRFLDGQSMADIAEALSLSDGTVKATVHGRARYGALCMRN